MEQLAKGKLKDSQLVKAQKRVKELEASIHEWEAQGIKLPPIKSTVVGTAPPSTISPVQMAAKPPPLNASTSSAAPPPSQPKPTPTAPAANASPLPHKPAPTGPAGTAGPARGGLFRGTGRGVPSGVGRGGLRAAPVKPTIPSPTSVAPTAGVSIMGAATKRPREEAVPAEDLSLAKRLKPAEP